MCRQAKPQRAAGSITPVDTVSKITATQRRPAAGRGEWKRKVAEDVLVWRTLPPPIPLGPV